MTAKNTIKILTRFSSQKRGYIRRGSAAPLIFAAISAVAVGTTAFVIWSNNITGNAGEAGGELFEVVKGNFDVIVPANGELSARNQIELRNPLEVRSVITWIVDEGKTVKKGDVLFRLAEEDLRKAIEDAELTVLAASNSVTASTSNLDIQQSQNESRLSKGQLAVELAELALEQWTKGDVVVKRESLKVELEKAERNKLRLTEKFDESTKLFAEGHISRNDFKLDEIAKIDAESNLEIAKLNIEIYENYQYKRDEKQNLSDLEQAKEELLRTKQQNEAELTNRRDDLETKQGQLDIRQSKLEDWKIQLEQCVITAPSNGLVVYASSLESGGGHRGSERTPPQIGTELRRNEMVIILPDVTQMIAAVKVHESISGQVKPGQRATIVSDAMPNLTLKGVVYNVGVLAETGSWRDPNRRDYTVKILLDDATDNGLKPSMRCKAEILLEKVVDAIYVPIQSVYRAAGMAFVYVTEGSGYAQREVKVGKASELNVEILEGLETGELVLLREPAPSEIVSKLDIDENVQTEPMSTPENENTVPRNPQPGSGGMSGGSGGGGGSFMSRLDKNGDGKIQKDELPERMQGMMDRLDTNSDGEIDQAEMDAASANMRQGGPGSGGNPGGSGGSRGGRGGGGGSEGGDAGEDGHDGG